MQNKLAILLLIFLTSLNLSAQDTIYYNQDWKKIKKASKKNPASYYTVLDKNPEYKSIIRSRNYHIDGAIISENNFSDYKEKIYDGRSKAWYANDQLESEIDYSTNKLNGEYKTYWKNGVLKRNDHYKNGEFISGKCYSHEGKDTTYYELETEATFPGGTNSMMQFVNRNLKFSDKSMSKLRKGSNYIVTFTVGENGNISAIHFINKTNKYIAADIITMVKKMPKWTPGTFDGEPVKQMFNLPIRIKVE